MGKLIKRKNSEFALLDVINNIDKYKFFVPINIDILKKNGWESGEDLNDDHIVWFPNIEEEHDEDFDDFYIWYWEAKGVWCYRYAFGTYVYDIKSIGELEIILGREGFVYEFEI